MSFARDAFGKEPFGVACIHTWLKPVRGHEGEGWRDSDRRVKPTLTT